MIFSNGDVGVSEVDTGDVIPYGLYTEAALGQHLSRVFSAGDTTKWVYSDFIKRGTLGAQMYLFGAKYNSNYYDEIGFDDTDHLYCYAYSSGGSFFWKLLTTRQFKNTDAFVHIYVRFDLSNAVPEDRIQLWVNGVRETSFSAVKYPTSAGYLNSAQTHYLGQDGFGYYFDGYRSGTKFIGGSLPAVTEFGRISADTGQWVAKNYTGSLSGVNSFKLEFKNSANLGEDTSGNNNHWTLNGGINSTNQVSDTPTNNFCVLNPAHSAQPLSYGNLRASSPQVYGSRASFAFSSGKWVWWVTLTAKTSWSHFGVLPASVPINVDAAYTSSSCSAYSANSGQKVLNGVASAYGATGATGDVFRVECNADANTMEIFKQTGGSGSFVSLGSFTMYTPAGTLLVPFVCDENNSSSIFTLNFGQRPQADTPTAGFKTLCTANLPDVPIKNGKKHFDVLLHGGNGASTQDVTGTQFQPDLAWQKIRNTAGDHGITDVVRGVSAGYLNSASTSAETGNANNGVSAFLSNGFTAKGSFNTSGNSWATWLWKMGGAPVANTQGSIQSQVSANVEAGQTVVAYNGNYTAGATVGHGLLKELELVIIKNRDGSFDWPVYCKAAGTTVAGLFNQTNSFGTSSYFNGVAPTSSVFSLGANNLNNQNLSKHVALCFHSVEGYSKVGYWDGTGVNPGLWVYCGFKPRFILGKCATLSGSWWFIFDTVRNTVNPLNSILAPHLANSESTSIAFEVSAFGFRVVSTSSDYNGSGHRYIFYAIAECPSKYATAF